MIWRKRRSQYRTRRRRRKEKQMDSTADGTGDNKQRKKGGGGTAGCRVDTRANKAEFVPSAKVPGEAPKKCWTHKLWIKSRRGATASMASV